MRALLLVLLCLCSSCSLADKYKFYSFLVNNVTYYVLKDCIAEHDTAVYWLFDSAYSMLTKLPTAEVFEYFGMDMINIPENKFIFSDSYSVESIDSFENN